MQVDRVHQPDLRGGPQTHLSQPVCAQLRVARPT
jgi:hypothetical protein